MMRFFCFLLLIFVGHGAYAQIISGRVLDKQTNAPLPYVHIGVMNRNVGTISRENGQFELDVSNVPTSEKITFSMVGYSTVHLTISSITSSEVIVSLTPSVTVLKEIVVYDKPIVDLIKLGRPIATKTTMGHSGSREWGTGGEWGLKIPVGENRFKLHTIAFHMRFNTIDSILFRINIFSMSGDLPGESLLNRDIYVTSYKNDKWITKDLDDKNIVLEADFVVTMEVIRIWYSKHGDNELFFTYGKNDNELVTFSRQSSQDKWRIGEMPPLAMYVTVRKLNE